MVEGFSIGLLYIALNFCCLAHFVCLTVISLFMIKLVLLSHDGSCQGILL